MASKLAGPWSTSATRAFLASHDTGVLSVASGDDPYAIPVFFGFDPDADRCLLRLVSSVDSQKATTIAEGVTACLVVHETTADAHRSAIATGRLEPIASDELDVDTIERFGAIQPPLFDLWEEPRDELDIDLYRLAVADLTGRLVEMPE